MTHQDARARRERAGINQRPSHTIYVDGDSPHSIESGAASFPFKTISEAVSVVPVATTADEMRNNYNIVIEPGTYDEDLTIDVTGRRIMLQSIASWNLGLFDGASWNQSGTRRNIRLIGDCTNIDGIGPTFGITTMNTSNRESQSSREWMGARISGELTKECNGGIMDIHLEGEILGTTGGSSGVSISDALGPDDICFWTFGRARFRGDVSLANGRIRGERFRVDGDILQTGGGYHILRYADIRGNLQTAPAFSSDRPRGIFTSEIAGDLIAIDPGDVFLMDPATVARQLEFGGDLQNGAVIEFQDGNATQLFEGGGTPTAGQFYEAHATSGGTAAALGISTRSPLPNASYLTQLTFETTSADATTVFNIRVDGTTVDTITLTGASGSMDLAQSKVAKGETVAVEYVSGTAPGASAVRIFGRSSGL